MSSFTLYSECKRKKSLKLSWPRRSGEKSKPFSTLRYVLRSSSFLLLLTFAVCFYIMNVLSLSFLHVSPHLHEWFWCYHFILQVSLIVETSRFCCSKQVELAIYLGIMILFFLFYTLLLRFDNRLGVIWCDFVVCLMFGWSLCVVYLRKKKGDQPMLWFMIKSIF